jgi:hypothetical protein
MGKDVLSNSTILILFIKNEGRQFKTKLIFTYTFVVFTRN